VGRLYPLDPSSRRPNAGLASQGMTGLAHENDARQLDMIGAMNITNSCSFAGPSEKGDGHGHNEKGARSGGQAPGLAPGGDGPTLCQWPRGLRRGDVTIRQEQI
jgi:hypothetical protein